MRFKNAFLIALLLCIEIAIFCQRKKKIKYVFKNSKFAALPEKPFYLKSSFTTSVRIGLA